MHRRRSSIHRPRRLLVAGAVLLALVAAACGDGGDRAPEMPAAPVTTTPSEQATSPQADQGTPDTPPATRELRFTAPALGGGQIRGRDFAGQDLVIWFWAPW